MAKSKATKKIRVIQTYYIKRHDEGQDPVPEMRERIVFSGNENAYKIWQKGHKLPDGSRIEEKVIQD